jgi:hypothetical protein
MRVCFRACLVAVLTAGILSTPAFTYAASDTPLGMVIQAEGLTHLGAAKAAIGSTVYTGDNLFTETGGTMRLRVGASQVYLLSDSGASLSQSAKMVHIVVAHGTVGFSSPANEPVGLDTPLGFVHPVDGHAAFGQVTLVSSVEMVVTAYHGDLIVEENGNLHTIPEGKSYRVTKDLEQPSQPSPSSSGQTKKGAGTTQNAGAPPLIEKVLIIGGAAGAALAVALELCESPSTMSCMN